VEKSVLTILFINFRPKSVHTANSCQRRATPAKKALFLTWLAAAKAAAKSDLPSKAQKDTHTHLGFAQKTSHRHSVIFYKFFETYCCTKQYLTLFSL